MFNPTSSVRLFLGRNSLIAIFAVLFISVTAAGSNAAGYSILNSVREFLGLGEAISASMKTDTALRPLGVNSAIDFDGTDDRLTFGNPAALKLTTFTIETWFRRDGAGATTTTGALTTAVPLVTKGRGEGDGSNIDANYFLGIDNTTGVIAADFEDSATGANHPIMGRTVICNGVWYHAAATFDGTKWQLFLNGKLERELNAAFTPRSDSIQHFGIATAYNSTGVAAGFFNGAIDDVRVWNHARSAAEILSNLGTEIPSATGLVGSWSMNEGSGGTTADGSGNGNTGTLTSGPLWTTGTPFAVTNNQNALDLNPNTYVTFGAAPGLNAVNFTLEAWVRRDAAGIGTGTGGSGLVSAVPVITKGRGEAENSNVDTNYFFGIDTTTNALAVDFEEGAGQPSPGLNHPFIGTTPINIGTWYHVAATYDGAVWRLYVNGILDATSPAINRAPRSDSIQHSAIGSSLTSTGVAAGFFNGAIDEVRIWNVVRSQTDIQNNQYNEIASGTGLLGRWGFNHACGTLVTDYDPLTPIDGTITGAGGSAWISGFPVPDGTPPSAPTGLGATPGNTIVALSWTANSEGDLAGYNIYRSTTPSVPLTSPINGGTLVTGTTYNDTGRTNGQIYYYVITAVDNSTNESAASNEVNATPVVINTALQFNGSNQYATLGTTSDLRSSTFTVELWFKRTGAGVASTSGTGTGGIANPIPLITKGRAEAENAGADINYFFGIDATSGKLIADFEEAQVAQGGTTPSANHPITGTAVIAADNTWRHAAATYDGTTWNLYLDGVLDGSLVVNRPANALTNVLTSVGSARTTAGVASGFFAGVVDEVRVWNTARSQVQIQATKNVEMNTGQPGLLGVWNLNEGSGSSLADNSGNNIFGVTINGPIWVPGFVPPAINIAPNAPTLNAPADAATGVATSPTLDVNVSDPNGDALTVTYFGRPFKSGNFVQIAQHTGISSGSGDTTAWANRAFGQTFEWYVTVGDASLTTTGPIWTFHTIQSPDPVFVGTGDIGSCSVTTDTDTGNVISGVDGTIFTTGDNVYPNGTLAEFNSCYGTTPWGIPSVLSRTRPVPGNHDWGTGAQENLNGYFSYYGANATDTNGKSYYSYDIPSSNWHVVNLDSECQLVIGGCGVGSPQEVWLRADLAANSTKNVIGLWHKPRYSSGSTNYQDVAPLWDALYDAGVDILLVGHDHIYERFVPMKAGATLASPPVADPLYGIHQFTVGTGGEAHHGLGTPLATSAVGTDAAFGVLKLTLHATSYDWAFLPIDGTTFTDSGTGTVHGPPGGPNNAPVAVGDAYSTPLNTALNVSAPGVLSNDSDLDLDTLTTVLDTNVSNGSLSLNSDGSFLYTPTNGYNGQDSFTYHANDGTANSNIVTVSLSVGTVTTTFQNGTNGYNGTEDTFLRAAQPTTAQGALDMFGWDQDEGTGLGPQFSLIRFDNLFGPAPGQLPAGVFITSATLSFTVFDVGDDGQVNEASVAWTEGSTYNDFGGEPGVQSDEYGNLLGEANGSATGVQTVDVTSSLTAWHANPALNRGWIIRPQGTNGVDVRSSEYATVGQRPVLSVTYSTTQPNRPPNMPTLVSPANNATGVSLSPDLTVNVSDPDGDPLTVTYFGRPTSLAPAPDFTIIAVPDTQHYTDGVGPAANFYAQTQWIVAQKNARNIVFISQLGDNVQNGDNGGNPAEWIIADTAWDYVEDPNTTGLVDGIPFGQAVGNHDQSPIGSASGTTTFFNQYFGESRFLGRAYYGGHYGTNNDNSYQLFSASGMDFIIIHFEYDTVPDAPVLAWANSLLQTHSNRRAILSSHHFVNIGNPGSYSAQGQVTYDALKGNPNLFLMLGGHVHGEGRRQDTFNSVTVNSILSDYQERTNGGDGWLRIMTFKPSIDQVQVQTYSPTLNQYETDSDSQFTFSYDMAGSGGPYGTIGQNSNVPGLTATTMSWPGRSYSTEYEWYVTVSDGQYTTTSPTFKFMTSFAPTAANASVSGSVVSSRGSGISNAVVTLTNADGESVSTRTSPFGYFQFENVESGATYVLDVRARWYAFRPRTITVADSIEDLIIAAER